MSDPQADAQQRAIETYWATARFRAKMSGMEWLTGDEAALALTPPAWSFGASAAEADDLLDLVLAGEKTATSSAAGVYSQQEVDPPAEGDLSIILDGHGRPRALVVTTAVRVCTFEEAGADHAAAEGEGDRSLQHWRHVHRQFFTDELAEVGIEFTAGSLVVLERFRLLDPR